MLSTATPEISAAIYSLRETSNLLSTYSSGGIIPSTQPENRAKLSMDCVFVGRPKIALTYMYMNLGSSKI